MAKAGKELTALSTLPARVAIASEWFNTNGRNGNVAGNGDMLSTMGLA